MTLQHGCRVSEVISSVWHFETIVLGCTVLRRTFVEVLGLGRVQVPQIASHSLKNQLFRDHKQSRCLRWLGTSLFSLAT